MAASGARRTVSIIGQADQISPMLLLSTCRRLYLLLGEYRGRFWLLILGMVGAAFATAGGIASVIPVMGALTRPAAADGGWRFLLDKLSSDPSVRFAQALLSLLVLMSLSVVAQALVQKLTISFTQRLTAILSVRAFKSYLQRDLIFHLGRDPVDLTKSILSEVSSLVSGGIQPMMALASSTITLLIVFVLLLAISPLPSIATLGLGLLVYGAISFRLKSRAIAVADARLKWNHERARIAQEAFASIREIKIYDASPLYTQRFNQAMLELSTMEATLSWMRSLPRYIVEVTTLGAVIGAIIFSGTVLDRPPEEMVGTVGVFAVAALRLIPQGNAALAAVISLHAAGPLLDHLEDHVTVQESEDPREMANSCTVRADGTVQAQKVSFKYPRATRLALHGVDLKIEAGESVALVGASGSGKSTLADLLLGLLEPTSGRVIVGSKQGYDSASVRQCHDIGYVTQRVSLFNTNLKENIAVGVEPEEIDEELVARALGAVDLLDPFRDEGSGKVDWLQQFGADGRGVSGGQLQRIGIARALYRKPKILILDEATSAVDNQTEHLLIQNIQSFFNGITIIHIAHRLSTIRSCGRIIALEHGVIIGDGTYEEMHSYIPSLGESD
ncbi:ABC transporter ATP-binding protein/permease [bacterium]|nr:ABC transporter ATP-binding protein/permease [bacterium]